MAWLTGWNYRKKITIAGSTGAGTNYQVLLKIGESSGASGYDFHLEGHSASFPSNTNQGGDLRFTSSDGSTLLDFWVESVTGSSPNRVAYVWVEVADDLGSNRDIYCYYGNSSATNYSNPSNTFNFFDDFSGDLSKWTTTGGSWSINSGVLQYSGRGTAYDDFIYASSMSNISDCEIVAMCKFGQETDSRLAVLGRYTDSNNFYVLAGHEDPTYHQFRLEKRVGGTWTTLTSGTKDWVANTWYKFTFRLFGTSLKGYVDGGNEQSTTDSSLSSGKVALRGCLPSDYYVYYDNIIVRKYVSPEPSFSSASSEQIPVANTGNFFLFF